MLAHVALTLRSRSKNPFEKSPFCFFLCHRSNPHTARGPVIAFRIFRSYASADAVKKSNVPSSTRHCRRQDRRRAIALSQQGAGKAIVTHGVANAISPERSRINYFGVFLKINFSPKWYLFPERVTYCGVDLENQCMVAYVRIWAHRSSCGKGTLKLLAHFCP